MKWKAFAAVALVLVLASVLVWLAVPTAFACIPDDDNGRCIVVRPALRTTPKIVAVAKATAVPTPVQVAARGTSPFDAIAPDDAWRTIDPSANVWYKIGEGINPQHFEVWLDAWGKPGLEFAVYSPEQMNNWSPDTPPKGRGTQNKADMSHDLWWIGQAPAGGTWFVRVISRSTFPLAYKIGYNRLGMSRKDCGPAYWEFLPDGRYVLWPGYCPPGQ